MAVEKEKALTEKLAEYKESLSQEELDKLVADTKHLKEYQDAEETEEALKTIPLLKEEEHDRESAKIYNTEKHVDDTLVLHHEIDTNGIGYLELLFDMKHISGRIDFLYGKFKICFRICRYRTL